jgi:ABC-type transport system involved in cytochrome c biogenesis ATPase subunit
MENTWKTCLLHILEELLEEEFGKFKFQLNSIDLAKVYNHILGHSRASKKCTDADPLIQYYGENTPRL